MQLDRDMMRRAEDAIREWRSHVWTIQGFGMLRTYLDANKEWRLNIWTDRFRVPFVSDIHDHPWDFTSWVMCGLLLNRRFQIMEEGPLGFGNAAPYHMVNIATGEGGGPVEAEKMVYLMQLSEEHYFPGGGGYSQLAREIHQSIPERGTVTLNRRGKPSAAHTARVFWKMGEWVSAEPRLATKDEVAAAISDFIQCKELESRT